MTPSAIYPPLLTANGFQRWEGPSPFSPLGQTWQLSPDIGSGFYWIYQQQDRFNIKIHDFTFHEDTVLDIQLPALLSITRYDSISGDELAPYRRLTAGCVKTFVGGQAPFRALIHGRIPVRAIGIEISPAYYDDYLRAQYPDDEGLADVSAAFCAIDETDDFPALSALLTEVQCYPETHANRGTGDGLAAKLFYESKVAEAVALVLDRSQSLSPNASRSAVPLSAADRASIDAVTAYLNDHYAASLPLERLAQIACMGVTKLKTCFRCVHGCTITTYIQERRISRAEHLLAHTDLSIGQIAQSVGYSTSSRLAALFKKNTGLLPNDYRRLKQTHHHP